MSDLLLKATPGLLTGWCGPVTLVFRTCTPVHINVVWWRGGLLDDADGWWDDQQEYTDHIHLDLSRAECRDRVARVLAAVLVYGAAYGAPRWVYGLSRPGWVIDCGPTFARRWFWREGCLVDLDPADDTRLSDGSRRVDAMALLFVARGVLGE